LESEANGVYLAPAEYIDSDHPAIIAFVAKTVTPDMPAPEKVRRFYLAAREIRYDPDLDYSDPEIYRASSVLQAGNAYCVGKAALFAALCRASGIPARVAFADVTNHLSSEKLREFDDRQDRGQTEARDGRRRHRPRRVVDAQLQGRPRRHRQGAGGAPLPDDPRHRFRRHRREPRRIRIGSPATRSSSTAGAWARPISAPMPRRRASRATGWCAAGGHDRPRGDGDRHRRLHRDAGRDGAGAHGLTPDRGPVVVTGAAGGVGSVAIALLSKLGFTVIASTGRRRRADYLKGLGAAEIIDRKELSGPASRSPRSAGPAASTRSARPRSPTCLSMTKYGGAVAACGLAGGMDLPTRSRRSFCAACRFSASTR
jgi:hypothetical protein